MLKNNNWSIQNPVRGATWLALVSLAWLQLTLASHQFDHVAEYFADTCHVCAQLDRTDDLVVDTQFVPAPDQARRSEPAPIVRAEFKPDSARPFHPRAPPLL